MKKSLRGKSVYMLLEDGSVHKFKVIRQDEDTLYVKDEDGDECEIYFGDSSLEDVGVFLRKEDVLGQ